jgi:pimeloyl-ACP methyl ester carboxylesterase
VITIDLLGHGESERPRDMTLYSMALFAEQAIALLDHLELDEAVLGGTSLGANVTLEAAAIAPERLRGMVVEMPVLDNALLACAVAFTPLLLYLTFGAPLARLNAAVARRLPRGLWHWADVGLDWVGQDPGPSAAVLQGLFFGRIAPPSSERRRIETPALVFGHTRDPIHPFNDADTLVRELRGARLVEASSMIEFRLTPDRLLEELARFLDDCWRPTEAHRPRPRRASA